MAARHDLLGVLAMCLLPACAQDAFEDDDLEQIWVAATLDPAAGLVLRIETDVPVHWVEVLKCDAEGAECTPLIQSEERFFDASVLVWETSMATRQGSFGPAMTGEPRIRGPIIYGQLPDNASFQTEATPLEDGGRYLVNAYQTGSCESAALDCLRMVAAGGYFFEIVDGNLNELEPKVVE